MKMPVYALNPVAGGSRRRVAPLPRWSHRPAPRPVARDHRVMLVLAAVCGFATLSGFILQRGQANSFAITLCFLAAYFSGGWFATQDVCHALKRGRVDIQRAAAHLVAGLFGNRERLARKR